MHRQPTWLELQLKMATRLKMTAAGARFLSLPLAGQTIRFPLPLSIATSLASTPNARNQAQTGPPLLAQTGTRWWRPLFTSAYRCGSLNPGVTADAAEPDASSTQGEAANAGTSSNSTPPPTEAGVRGLVGDTKPCSFGIEGFEGKSNGELARMIFVFSVCKVKPFVKHGTFWLKVCNRLIGKTATSFMMRRTFFSHFCGGESLQDLEGCLKRLAAQRVGGILDYAAEKDVATVPGTQLSAEEIEQNMDYNSSLSKEAIEASSREEFGLVAVKLTSLFTPELLKKANALLLSVHDLFAHFVGETDKGNLRCTPAEKLLGKQLTRDEFVSRATECLGIDASSYFGEVFDRMTSLPGGMKGTVNYFQFTDYLSPDRISSKEANVFPHGHDALTGDEVVAWARGMERCRDLANFASQFPSSSIMVDAEQTYMQTSIDYVTLKLQAEFNKERAVVFNTYQAYLKDAFGRVVRDYQRADAMDYKMGLKLVRGAYMFQERRLAKERNYADPINDTLIDTHDMYDTCVSFLLRRLERVQVLLGTHNETSVRKAISVLRELKVDPSTRHVVFGQLLGMCDHITLGLSAHGFRSFKYVPYGPLDLVMPYLMRRSEENSDMLGSSTTELRFASRLLAQRAKRAVLGA